MLEFLLFGFSILLFTRLDYLINKEFYGYGLQFSEQWYSKYGVIYFLLYQLSILFIYLYSFNIRFLLLFEAFVLSSTQDLIYFGVWGHGEFPEGNWVWMPQYKIFKTWTTKHQILLSFFCNLIAVLGVTICIGGT